jgi:hypothetical protein
MNIYLISQTTNRNYDTYDSAIVCAKNEDDAKYIHPDRGRIWNQETNNWGPYIWDYAWTSPENVSVKYIGVAGPDITEGVVLASFNAG